MIFGWPDDKMCPARVLLANEFGRGRGHLVKLRDVAQGLGPRFTYDAALCQRGHDDVFAGIGAAIYDGPALNYDTRARKAAGAYPTATWGEFLGDLGFSDPDRVAQIVAWWRQVMISRDIAAVVADYAPLALVAARSLEIPSISIGQGYGMPPWNMERFPSLDDRANICLHDESDLLANVNTALRPYGTVQLETLPEVYWADLTILRTFPMLDFYAQWRTGEYYPPPADFGDDLASSGTEVFIYYAQQELSNPALFDAILTLPYPRRAYLPNVAPEIAQSLRESGVIIEDAPVQANLIARRSRLVLNAGQHGTLALALLSGLPQVCVCFHMEQTWHAQAAQRAGVAQMLPSTGLTPEAVIAAIRGVYEDDTAAQRARQTALALRADVTEHGQPRMQQALDTFAQKII
jgi:hypothetical protein